MSSANAKRDGARASALAVLRQQIGALETMPSGSEGLGLAGVNRVSDHVSLGVESLDPLLLGGGLARTAVHEVLAHSVADLASAMGFAAGLLGRFACEDSHRPLVWCQPQWEVAEWGSLYGPGLTSFGIDPARVVMVHPRTEKDLLWALEEAVGSGVPAAVFGALPHRGRLYDLTSSRRLHLAAAAHHVPVVMLRGAVPVGSVGPSAASTRWRVQSQPSLKVNWAGLGAACWRVALEKGKGSGEGRRWDLTWQMREARFKEISVAPEYSMSLPVRMLTRGSHLEGPFVAHAAEALEPLKKSG